MIAARCVPIGLGGDIGGSLRWPAVFCGIYGFKPSIHRVSRLGSSPARLHRFSAFNHLVLSVGPMGSSVDDLVRCMSLLSSDKVHELDPETVPMGWHWNKAEAILASP